jgi:hypothetical protein
MIPLYHVVVALKVGVFNKLEEYPLHCRRIFLKISIFYIYIALLYGTLDVMCLYTSLTCMLSYCIGSGKNW